MSILAIAVATTITFTSGFSKGNSETKMNNSVILVESANKCGTDASQKEIENLRKAIEGTKVAKVLSIDCES